MNSAKAYVFNPLFTTLKSFSGSSFLVLKSGFVVLLASQLTLWRAYQWPNDYLPTLCFRSMFSSDLNFDFIVVGSGAAGSVIANRLSENWTVLLIEAGQDPLVDSMVPSFFPFNLNSSRAFLYHAEVVNTSSNAYKNGTPLQCGKMLGGSTGMNAMMYICGTDRDYDYWATLGNVGWNYNQIQQFIKKSEDNSDNSTVAYKTGPNGAYHGTGGFLMVSNYSSNDPFVPVLRAGFSILGYKQLRDYNSGEYNGFVEVQGTLRGGERCSAARAFLLPIKNRPNLYVVKSSTVSSIIFNGKTATGVNIKTNYISCGNIKANANKEVIISAGALGSPKILLNSGIGRSADLTPFGIKQVQSLAVGDNLQDHVESIHFIKVNPDAPKQTIEDDLWDAQNYYFFRNGSYSNLGTINYNGFINTLDVNANYPEVQFIFYRFAKSQEYFTKILTDFGFKDKYIATLVDINNDFELVMVFTILLNPKSRGTVKLRSSNPFDSPKITSGYFSAEDDATTLLRAINKLQQLVNTDPMNKTSAELVKFNITECNPVTYATDAYWRCYLKYFSASIWHPTGTCKMGPPSDPSAVVDPMLKVFNISQLRVADASIMPVITTGNTQCPTYMIGEKAADMIIKDWS